MSRDITGHHGDFKRRGVDRRKHHQHGGRDQSKTHADGVHDAIGDQFGPIVIPADRASRHMRRRRSELLKSENGHGGSGECCSEAIKHRSREVNERSKSSPAIASEV